MVPNTIIFERLFMSLRGIVSKTPNKRRGVANKLLKIYIFPLSVTRVLFTRVTYLPISTSTELGEIVFDKNKKLGGGEITFGC